MKLGGTKYIIGYDISDDYSQISYAPVGSDSVDTLSSVSGGENFRIPTVLCKKSGENRWFYGNEALRMEKEDGILIRNLLTLAVDGEMRLIDGEEYDPVALLTLFVKRSMGLLSQLGDVKIDSLVFTGRNMQPEMLEVLGKVVAAVKPGTDKVYFLSHGESYYYYMLYQQEELWQFKSLLADYHLGDRKLTVYELEVNRKTTPVAVFVDRGEYPVRYGVQQVPSAEPGDEQVRQRLDGQFLEVIKEICMNKMISSVYLIGEGFDGDWMQESLRYLCKGRRVFRGNNLFSKGACYYGMERVSPGKAGTETVLLGQDNLRVNVGMNVYRQGQESYLALLDAGVKWHEAEGQAEVYLQEDSYVELLITPLTEHRAHKVKIPLTDLQGDISRIRIHLFFKEENILVAELEDLGFGEIRPATGQIWSEEIKIC